jgi:uncharacterized protein YbaA (DUF1428 family)
MTYVDGFVLPVALDKVEEYRKMAEDAGKIWMEHGALAFNECMGDDLQIQDMLSFSTVAGAKEDETVMFSFIVFRDRAHRDEVNAKVMADPRLKGCGDEDKHVFDFKRMAYGGFKSIVQLNKA